MCRSWIARGLAEVFLTGSFDERALLRRADMLFGGRWLWIERFVRDLVRSYRNRTLPRHRELVGVILRSVEFSSACDRCEDWIYFEDEGWTSHAHEMNPVPAATGWPLPSLRTSTELERWLGLTPCELEWFADRRGWEGRLGHDTLRHYHYRPLTKRGGAIRMIEAPKARLKCIQRCILRELLEHVPLHEAVHGFRRGRNVVSFAEPHVGQHVVVRLDLEEFFPSIRAGRIRTLFRTLGYPEKVADDLGALCTNVTPYDAWPVPDDPRERLRMHAVRRRYADPHLPQGAPTSPYLANLCAFRMDFRLAAFARSLGARYTRYADDLAFSGTRSLRRALPWFLKTVVTIVEESGFTVHQRKTRVMTRATRQHLAGLVINEHPNVTREAYERLKATLTNCVRHGPASQNREGHPDYRSHLRGRVAFVRSIHSTRGAKLQALFDRIAW